MSYKSVLHELCQKRGWGVPRYQTKRSGGRDHEPIFESLVTCGSMKAKLPGVGKNVREAEQEAAFLFLSTLNKEKVDESPQTSRLISSSSTESNFSVSTDSGSSTIEEKSGLLSWKSLREDVVYLHPAPSDVKHIMMIDGENLQKLVDKIPPKQGRQVILYLSKHHPLAVRDVATHVIKKIAPCTRQDGCDIFMTMDIINLAREYPNVRQITIYSRDKFAAAVADNAPSFFGSKILVNHDVYFNDDDPS